MAKAAARSKNRDWEINLDSLEKLLQQGCFYCGESLFKGIGYNLDRVDNAKGYTMNNVLPACWSCNRIRGDRLSVEETLAAVEGLLTYRKYNEHS